MTKTLIALTKQQKMVALVVVGVSVLLLIRFGGWVILLRSLRWLIPIALVWIIWKKLVRR
jgi:hypothetical protein